MGSIDITVPDTGFVFSISFLILTLKTFRFLLKFVL
jgi:hypothetical protein